VAKAEAEALELDRAAATRTDLNVAGAVYDVPEFGAALGADDVEGVRM
jgi:hypothetical protein